MYNDLFSCKGKVVLVTGGCGLIGRELAQALKEFGATVSVADRNEMKSDNEIKDSEIKFIDIDIAVESSIREAIAELIQHYGRIDILVNSAYPRTHDWGLKFEKIPFDSWRTNVDSHLGGYFLCSQIVADQMKKQGGGVIINMASIYGVVAPDFSLYEGTEMTMPAAYSAIKGGIIAITKYIATYYGKYNVRANTISPGGIFDGQPATFVERYSQKTPLGRMGMPHEIVGATIFLASDASSYVTGQNLIIDGGWTAW